MLYDIFVVLYLVLVVVGVWFIFGKAGIAKWKALIPFYNIVLWIKLVGKSWKWYIWFLIPGINIFMFLLLVVETSRVFRRTNFFEQLLGIIIPFVYLPWLGLSKQEYHDPKIDPPSKVSEGRDWAEAIVFAIVAAIIIRGKVFELYSIPSSSMEGGLLIGDHLLVSKMTYGPRPMMTPLSLPLMHNTVPGTNGKVDSYLRWPQLPYHRYWGYSQVKRYDAVVFNFPAGDTICTGYPTCLRTYYELVDELGREAVQSGTAIDKYDMAVGEVKTRPLDKRENYIKRCMGLPGETLEVRDQEVYINGTHIDNPQHAQFTYMVYFNPSVLKPSVVLDRQNVSIQDIQDAENIYLSQVYEIRMVAPARDRDSLINKVPYVLPLSREVAAKLERLQSVDSVVLLQSSYEPRLFGNNIGRHWTVDNYGPVHIPAKGEVLELNDSTMPFYRRLIEVYEHNTLEERDGQYYINGQPTNTYVVQQNYYWMMGDNRHNSQDSRYWGFVPEDHIAGKAKWVIFSWDKGRGNKIRKDRFLINASKY